MNIEEQRLNLINSIQNLNINRDAPIQNIVIPNEIEPTLIGKLGKVLNDAIKINNMLLNLGINTEQNLVRNKEPFEKLNADKTPFTYEMYSGFMNLSEPILNLYRQMLSTKQKQEELFKLIYERIAYLIEKNEEINRTINNAWLSKNNSGRFGSFVSPRSNDPANRIRSNRLREAYQENPVALDTFIRDTLGVTNEREFDEITGRRIVALSDVPPQTPPPNRGGRRRKTRRHKKRL